LIDIKEADAPANEPGVDAETARIRLIDEISVPVIVMERGCLPDVVGLDNIDPAVVVIIARRHPHAALLLTVGPVRYPARDRGLAERTVVIVAIEQTGAGIASYIEVGPAVIVKVGRDYAEVVVQVRQFHSRLPCNICEGAAVFVVIEKILPAG